MIVQEVWHSLQWMEKFRLSPAPEAFFNRGSLLASVRLVEFMEP